MRIKLTVQKIPEDRFDENDNDILTLDTSAEKSIYEWVDTFKLILYFLTFSYESVQEIFVKEDDERNDNEKTEEDTK